MKMSFANRMLSALAICLFFGTSALAAGQNFEYKFVKGQKLTYGLGMNVKLENLVDPNAAAQKSLNDTKLNLVMEVEVLDAAENITLAVTFNELSLVQVFNNAQIGNNKLTIKGGNVLLVRDGATIIDSTKNIAADLAELVKTKFAFVGVTGQVVIRADGSVVTVKNIAGTEAFAKFFKGELRNSLFGFVSPREPMGETESWTGREIKINKISSIKLSTGGFTYNPTYTFESLEGNVAKITRKSKLNEQGLDGMAQSIAGAAKTTGIGYYNRTENATIAFDVSKGHVINSTTHVNFSIEFTLTTKDDKDIDVKVTGTGSAVLTLKPKTE